MESLFRLSRTESPHLIVVSYLQESWSFCLYFIYTVWLLQDAEKYICFIHYNLKVFF